MNVKITLQEEPEHPGIEVILRCPSAAEPEVLCILSALRPLEERRLTGIREGQTFPLAPRQVLYAESVDHRTFLYGQDQVYESPLRLYELEERFAGEGFVRASKAVVINLDRLRSLRPDFGGRLILTMDNGEKLFASRQYAGYVKKRLGI